MRAAGPPGRPPGGGGPPYSAPAESPCEDESSRGRGENAGRSYRGYGGEPRRPNGPGRPGGPGGPGRPGGPPSEPSDWGTNPDAYWHKGNSWLAVQGPRGERGEVGPPG